MKAQRRYRPAPACPLVSFHSFPPKLAQAELQEHRSFNTPSRVHASRVLGRNHAAAGQHDLAVAAFDAALTLSQSRQLALSEALTIRERALAGQRAEADASSGAVALHWSDADRKQRLAEVKERMDGPRELLDELLRLQC